MLESLREGQVYELLLISRSNVTPVGVVRRGSYLHFKLFHGRSFSDLLNDPRVSIQMTNSAELLVGTALNLDVELAFESNGSQRWIRGLPGWAGIAECRKRKWEDGLGATTVLECRFTPLREIPGQLEPVPFSRADCILVEMAVLFTRYRVKPSAESKRKILELWDLYRHLGGSSQIAKYMVENL